MTLAVALLSSRVEHGLYQALQPSTQLDSPRCIFLARFRTNPSRFFLKGKIFSRWASRLASERSWRPMTGGRSLPSVCWWPVRDYPWSQFRLCNSRPAFIGSSGRPRRQAGLTYRQASSFPAMISRAVRTSATTNSRPAATAHTSVKLPQGTRTSTSANINPWTRTSRTPTASTAILYSRSSVTSTAPTPHSKNTSPYARPSPWSIFAIPFSASTCPRRVIRSTVQQACRRGCCAQQVVTYHGLNPYFPNT